MEKKSEKKNLSYIVVNVVIVIVFVVFEILSSTILSSPEHYKLLCRVIARGLLGTLFIYNSLYLLLTSKWSFLCTNATPKQRLICGIVLGLGGLVGLITAILGYGTNGDPRFIWWK